MNRTAVVNKVVKYLREGWHITQACEKAGPPRSTVRRWCLEDPSIMKKIADARYQHGPETMARIRVRNPALYMKYLDGFYPDDDNMQAASDRMQLINQLEEVILAQSGESDARPEEGTEG